MVVETPFSQTSQAAGQAQANEKQMPRLHRMIDANQTIYQALREADAELNGLMANLGLAPPPSSPDEKERADRASLLDRLDDGQSDIRSLAFSLRTAIHACREQLAGTSPATVENR